MSLTQTSHRPLRTEGDEPADWGSTYDLGDVLPEAVLQSLPSVEQLQMELELVAAEFEEKADQEN